MTRIKELIEDFKQNQEILGREKKYIELCMSFGSHLVRLKASRSFENLLNKFST